MRKILIDTNFYVAFKSNEPDAVQVIREAEMIGVNTVVIGELLAGFRGGGKESINRHELDLFLDSRRVQMFSVDDETAEYYRQGLFRL